MVNLENGDGVMSWTDFRWPLVVMRDHRDGTEIAEGERIRYHQKPGGILPPCDWTYGVASYYEPPEWASDSTYDDMQLFLKDDDGRFYGVAHHIVERVDA